MILEAKRLAKQEGRELRIITLRQMFQRLPLLMSEISAGNKSESLLNEIRQIVYSLYRSKKFPKKYIINKSIIKVNIPNQ